MKKLLDRFKRKRTAVPDTREAADELQLEPGREVVCVVKSTDVIVELPQPRSS